MKIISVVLAGLLTSVWLSGCVMPRRGTPVFVDARAGSFWSGKGLLLEVSKDGRSCRVTVRDRALIVQEFWVDCQRVHPRG
ncbi:hypothetical protein MK489_22945 [Myxococcota bacterium]|nr:hypothetical protein [Myxococcota bacterium]